MNIVFFSHSSDKYGAELFLLETLTCLKESRENLELTVITPTEGPLISELEKIKVRYRVYPYKWWVGQKKFTYKKIRNVLNILAAWMIAKKIKKLKPNIICTNTITTNVGAFVAYFLEIPHIWFVHEFVGKGQDLKFDLGDKWSYGFMNKRTDKVITNSKTCYDFYAENIDKEKINWLYNKNMRVSKNQLNKARNDSFKCIIVGSINKNKNQELAIDAIKELKKSIKKISLLLVGDGDKKYVEFLKEKVKRENLSEIIHFKGYTDDPYPLIMASDVMLICSKQETFGRALIEGMIGKKPVIAPDIAAVSELISDKEDGIIYNKNNVEDLIKKVVEVYKNPKTGLEIGKRARKKALEFHQPEKYSQELIKMFKEVGKKV